jgi:hypothetical protein
MIVEAIMILLAYALRIVSLNSHFTTHSFLQGLLRITAGG